MAFCRLFSLLHCPAPALLPVLIFPFSPHCLPLRGVALFQRRAKWGTKGQGLQAGKGKGKQRQKAKQRNEEN